MDCLVQVATCNLNQWAMDFDLNLHNIRRSIEIAKEAGARLRTGPELELTGYGCEDHFLEQDTYYHAWKSLQSILSTPLTDDILCDIGMPVVHDSVRYNCRVIVANRKVILIRPKTLLANDGNYRETRWFSAWTRLSDVEKHTVPEFISDITGDRTVPFGVAALRLYDTSVAIESCEELFTPESPHIAMFLSGVEIILNGSGSHHNLRKLDTRLNLLTNVTAKCGGLYLYANQKGCDGGRLYYDGCALICLNGETLAQGSQFAIHDVEVITAVVDLEDIRSFRGCISSRSQQSSSSPKVPMVDVAFALQAPEMEAVRLSRSSPREIHYHTVEEEIALGTSYWLWDYLRRSTASGFFLPLSGGADSSAVACIVGLMCRNVMEHVKAGDETVIGDVRRLIGPDTDMPTTTKALANMLLTTVYMGTNNSSAKTRALAASLSADIGAAHLNVNIDAIISAFLSVFSLMFSGRIPSFSGAKVENLALQNLQARCRMVLSFLLAQLIPWTRGASGFLLVMGSSNVDEALRGYLTKYDCSSADLNPIGGISKGDLRRFLGLAKNCMGYASIQDILDAPPMAELEPITTTYIQTDEIDMGMTYKELGVFGRLRSIGRCGPVSMYQRLRHIWGHCKPEVVAAKVKHFFYFYSANRHKQTTLTPSLHAENYSSDDNRFDLRQFLYNTLWPTQFRLIDELVAVHQEVEVSKAD